VLKAICMQVLLVGNSCPARGKKFVAARLQTLSGGPAGGVYPYFCEGVCSRAATNFFPS
jgi:hypothetical protein